MDYLKEHFPDLPSVSERTVYNVVRRIREEEDIAKEAEPGRSFSHVEDRDWGERAQVDYGEKWMRTTSGRQVKAYFFAMELERSRYKFVFLQNVPFTAKATVCAHHLAFKYFGGMPRKVVYDQDKKMLTRENYGDYLMTEEFASYVASAGFEPVFCRAAEQTELEVAVEMQRRNLQSILDAGGSVDDDESIKKNYNWHEVLYDKKYRKLLSFSLDEKKIENVKKTSGFFGHITLGLDYTALQTLDAYGLRDEQEKYFCQMKTQMGFDRQRNWSEEGKTGRLLILFVSLIISSYVRHIW